LPVPVALAYCTDMPVSDTAVVPRLNSSMKSFWYGAPVFPPPPKTWLITTSAEGIACACCCETSATTGVRTTADTTHARTFLLMDDRLP
jgi:hypothetical protein